MPLLSLPKFSSYMGEPHPLPKDQDAGLSDAAALLQPDCFCSPAFESERNLRMARPRIRVLLADDCVQLRQMFVKFLGAFPDIEIAGEASNGRMAVELAKLLVPDVVIMDIDMPEMNGIEATRTIRNSLPQVGVVGLSMTDDADCRKAMRQAGAADFVSKIEPLDMVIRAIRTCSLAQQVDPASA